MKLEVGMYVRTKRDGIGKIISLSIGEEDDCCFIELSKRRTGIKEHNILKASHNIIDVLELGDIVELFMEKDLDKEDTNVFELIAITTDKKEIGVFNSDFQIDFYPIENLRRVSTKEQFESMSYKVGE